jgi:thiol-disulfide isomerase/thioredoxin
MFRFPILAGLAFLGLASLMLASNPGLAEDKKADADPFAALIDKPAPEIESGFTINGKPAKLADLKGKVVVLDFWAVWCGPCVATFPHLKEWQKEYHDKGLEIIGLTSYYQAYGFDNATGRLTRAPAKLTEKQEQDMLKGFVKHHKLEHRIVAVPQADIKGIYEQYKVQGIPEVVVIDRKGAVRLVKVGSGEANAKAVEEMIKKCIGEKG